MHGACSGGRVVAWVGDSPSGMVGWYMGQAGTRVDGEGCGGFGGDGYGELRGDDGRDGYDDYGAKSRHGRLRKIPGLLWNCTTEGRAATIFYILYLYYVALTKAKLNCD